MNVTLVLRVTHIWNGGESMLKANRNAFAQLMSTYDLNMTDLAKRIKMSRAQIYRVLDGECMPGGEFIGNFKKAFPDARFEDYFFIDSVS